jgi:outer membrane receptor protein involved in Fe transport
VSDFRIGRQYFDSSTLDPFYGTSAANAGSLLGIPGFNADVQFNNPGIPDFTISGFTGFSNSSTNWFQDDKTWQGSEQISWTRGSHNIIAGAELRKLTTGRKSGNSPRGIFSFNGQFTGYAPADFMLGFPQNLVTPLTQARGVVAEWRDGFFVLDNWQVSRKLTVNYGLRYELPTCRIR